MEYEDRKDASKFFQWQSGSKFWAEIQKGGKAREAYQDRWEWQSLWQFQVDFLTLFFFLHNHINLPFLYANCWYTYVVVVFSTDQVEPWSRKEQLGRSSAWWLRRQQRCSVWSPWRVCPRSGLNQSLLWRLGRSKGRFGGISFQWEDFESD